jgi:hypothetical protein
MLHHPLKELEERAGEKGIAVKGRWWRWGKM